MPHHIDYAVAVDVNGQVAVPAGGVPPGLSDDHDAVGRPRDRLAATSWGWEVDDELASHLDGCPDADLGWTPASNTVPIRRLGLEVGETAGITTAWVRFLELDVEASEQRYQRLAVDLWQYTSSDYNYQLVADPAIGACPVVRR